MWVNLPKGAQAENDFRKIHIFLDASPRWYKSKKSGESQNEGKANYSSKGLNNPTELVPFEGCPALRQEKKSKADYFVLDWALQ